MERRPGRVSPQPGPGGRVCSRSERSISESFGVGVGIGIGFDPERRAVALLLAATVITPAEPCRSGHSCSFRSRFRFRFRPRFPFPGFPGSSETTRSRHAREPSSLDRPVRASRRLRKSETIQRMVAERPTIRIRKVLQARIPDMANRPLTSGRPRRP